MHQLSNLLKFNVKINIEMTVADMTKNKLQNKIHHFKIWLTHASNPLQCCWVTGNNNSINI